MSVQLYLFRHADAVDVGQQGVRRDADHRLSKKGRDQAQRMAKFLHRIGCHPQQIATSPLVRARETGEIVAEIFEPPDGVEEVEDLTPGGSRARLVRWLNRKDWTAVLLVGHLPDLAELGAHLVAGDIRVPLALKKAGVLCLSFEQRVEPEKGQIEWLVQSNLLDSVR